VALRSHTHTKMPHTSSSSVAGLSDACRASHALVCDRAGERLYSYARVQEARQQQTRSDAQNVKYATHLFRPTISELARSPHIRRTPLYPAARKASPETSADVLSASSPLPLAPALASARVSPAQWRGFLSRAAVYEHRRSARLRELKLQAADEELREGTFRPKIHNAPAQAYAGVASCRASATGDRVSCVELTSRWVQEVEEFTREMERLQRELASLSCGAGDGREVAKAHR
jgi:hypothetical protein